MLSLTIAAALPLGALAPSCSTGTSTVGQRITCADHGAGAVSCRPMTAEEPPGTGSDSCEDVDEDGDGSPHDQGEDDHDGSSAPRIVRNQGGSGSDADDDDDDHDGIPNERDCDHRHGGDDDQDDDQGDNHDGSGSDGSGSDGSGHDGSGHDGSDDDGSGGGSGTH